MDVSKSKKLMSLGVAIIIAVFSSLYFVKNVMNEDITPLMVLISAILGALGPVFVLAGFQNYFRNKVVDEDNN